MTRLLFLIIAMLLLINLFQAWRSAKDRVSKVFYGFGRNLREKIAHGLQSLQKHIAPEPITKAIIYDLAPDENVDLDGLYSSRIDAGLSNPKVKNIALTGPYSSGKSSILKAFQNKYFSYHFLNISLATFSEEKLTDNTDKALVEQSIIQQIFYHVDRKAIPGSRFKRIRNLSNGNLFIRSLVVLSGIIFFILLFRGNSFNTIPGWLEFFKAHYAAVKIISLIGFIIICLLVLYSVFSVYRNSKFSKINLNSAEVEISPEDQSSILNKYLDEVLYFFQVTKYNVVIFEDLDRFKNPEIYTRLRELNTLINNAQQVGRKVNFIYAVKDDVFPDERRTKFFDLIIPVIPVVNISNSSEILRKWVNDEKLQGKITKQFLGEIGLYIDDMRLLKSVMNEFSLYRAKLEGFTIKYDNLLALIIYKNKYPEEFAKMHNNQGQIAGLFNQKLHLIGKLTSELNQNIGAWTKQIQLNDSVIIKNVKELRAIYLNALMETLGATALNRVYVGNEIRAIWDLREDAKLFDRLLAQNQIRYEYGNGSVVQEHTAKLNFPAIEKQVDPDKTFKQREQELAAKTNTTNEQLRDSVRAANKKIAKIRSYSMRDIVSAMPPNEIPGKIALQKLTLHLIRNGYIDEDYHYYISHFYEGSLTRKDVDFILSIKDRQALEVMYPLDNVAEIISRFRLHEFSVPAILNIQLVDFIWKSPLVYESQRQMIITQFSESPKETQQFVDQFIRKTEHQQAFIKDVAEGWPGWWKFIAQEPAYTNEQKDKYFDLICTYCDKRVLLAMDVQSSLYVYVSKKANFFSFFQSQQDKQKIKELIQELNIKFEKLDATDYDKDLFRFIYTNKLYAINPEMIRLVIEKMGDASQKIIGMLDSANYSVVRSSGCRELIERVEANIDNYVSNVVLAIESNTEEEEGSIVKLLNNEEVSDTNKRRLVEKENTRVSSISNIPHQHWHLLAEFSKMQPTWKNVMLYFSYTGSIDLTFRIYLANADVFVELSKEKMNENISNEEGLLKSIGKAILSDLQIPDLAVKYYAKSIPYFYNDIDLKPLSPDRISAMLENNLIDPSRK